MNAQAASRESIKTIALVGSGLHVWTAAAGLARKLKQKNALGQVASIRVVETPDSTAEIIGESTLASLHQFHRFLGLKEKPLMAATQATFKLANEYAGWHESVNAEPVNKGPVNKQPVNSQKTSFYHAHSPYGSMIDAVAFQHHLTKLRQMGEKVDLTNLSLPAVAAREGKFNHPRPGQKSLPFSYSFHIDAQAYAKGMKLYAQGLGVEILESNVKDVQFCDVGTKPVKHIQKLILEDDSEVEAELFIDCTASGFLIEKQLNVGYEDWSEFLPCDRFLTCLIDSEEERPANSKLKATTKMWLHDSGWCRRFPLQSGTVYEYFYSSDFQSDELAAENFLTALRKETKHRDLEIDLHLQRSGHREAFWSGNCVAMGAAAGNLDRLAATEFHLVQSAVLRLLDLMPDSSLGLSSDNASRDEYNALCQEEYARLLDYHSAHFVLAAGAYLNPDLNLGLNTDTNKENSCSSAFWQARKDAEQPESLVHKLGLFGKTGHFPFYERETFSDKTWISFLLGLGLEPEGYQPALDMPQASLERSRQAIRKMSEIAAKSVAAMPSHTQYLKQYCPSISGQFSISDKNKKSQSEPVQ